MLWSSVLVLLPLFVGYGLRLPQPRLQAAIGHTIEWLVYVILGLMGLSIGALDQLGTQLAVMSGQTLLLVVALGVANLLALWLWSRRYPWRLPLKVEETTGGGLGMFKGTAILLGVVFGGIALGTQVQLPEGLTDQLAEYTLMVLLLLIGCQLRNSGMSLKQVLLNRQGFAIAFVVVVSSLVIGGLIAPWLEVSRYQALALVSGFGWYSLSAILIGDGMGPVWGGAAFFNDLIRELVALLLIPWVMGRAPAVAIGYSGATSMDFTLPMIQKSGGMHCVPAAIVSGFLLSLLSPVLTLFFLSLAA
ncbi:hypothetical protein BFW38_00075 [Terasakiispira papahanaumokuakeensis]|uniref:Lysine exporter LysO family protein n=1 Tax=Terasakiispira papahanaumokuakeensis TaxID=197479 RepID=A0A1E2V5C1_9GAMM|nr:lysine exporter LysO family protein [Terasakiispira papahanaumokuakeensis]ODC02178.1 hypothetical protein BFW38_00075 [Terasakiispira papahanaumokuakeensis]